LKRPNDQINNDVYSVLQVLECHLLSRFLSKVTAYPTMFI